MKDYIGCNIPKLGFGLMRLPQKDGAIDIEQVKQMADHFFANGFTYCDTAYVYGGGASELAAKAAIVERYPRESFQLADKLPVINIEKEEDMEAFVQTSLERTGAGYFDFYLLHALNKNKLEICDKFGAWDFMVKLKERGLAKHVGFSFHDKAEVLDEILTKHPEMEFVQLQINYADWDNDGVQSRLCHEVAMKHGKPVIIMEPVKGGNLVTMTPEVQKTFKDANPDASIASWAVRYAASREGLITVLSGMSNMEQMVDNTSYMKDFQPLNDEENAVVAKVVEILNSIPTIPCTACEYCVAGCPMQINIPAIFKAYNNYLVYGNLQGAKSAYENAIKERGRASSCYRCGQCEAQCPQQINIIEKLAEIAKVLEA
ncbi:MAG: aldo/keto reductase [Clostridia bacterium]|nr:aldo/keto reductase [Clostridia bacterium]MBR5283762.1 aldo/keto reductase [Clostridia bacterium]